MLGAAQAIGLFRLRKSIRLSHKGSGKPISGYGFSSLELLII